MQKVILKIEGMSCSACQNRVEKYLNKQDGVEASVNLVMQQALIFYDETKVSLSDLDRFVEESGYKSLGVYHEFEETKKDDHKFYLIIFAFLTIFMMYISMGHMIGLPAISFLHMKKYPINYSILLLILVIPYLIFGFDILKSGITKLFSKSPNMDSLVTIGVLSSFIYSFINLIFILKGNYKYTENLYFESVATIIFFIKLGRFIDKKSKEKTKEAIKELVQITPKTALLKTKDGVVQVTIDEVKKGDILICKPGGKIAVDGIIVFGVAHLDESFITGEAKANKKEVKDKVIAGSINIDGYIEYKAERIGPDTTISEIVRLVVEGANTKAPIQRLADKISGIFVPSIMIISVLTLIGYLAFGFSFHEAIISFVTVLVVACPCALGLATPLAVVVSEGKAAKEGILIKTSETLEKVQKIDTILFDKTGTLTYGNLRISKIYNNSKYHDKELLQIVASLENNSNHPISSAFKSWVNENHIKIEHIEKFMIIPGIGLSGIYKEKNIYVGNHKLLDKLNITNPYLKEEKELSKDGNSIIYVIENKNVLALIGVKDIIRDNVKDTLLKLKKMNKKLIMLTGDNENTANTVGEKLGIDKVVANVLPQDKEKYLKELKKTGNHIMMVGDGINDAPALAASDIGVSVNSGTDIAADSSDVILMNDDLSKIVKLFHISKKTVKIIKENLFSSFFYNICMIPVAIGFLKPFKITLSPMIASIAMVISSLTVVFNSLRLRK